MPFYIKLLTSGYFFVKPEITDNTLIKDFKKKLMAEILLFLDQNSFKPAVINSKPIVADFLSYVEWSCGSFKKKAFCEQE